jgi:aminoglycoside phosphotransferase (APT) family kinase protein
MSQTTEAHELGALLVSRGLINKNAAIRLLGGGVSSVVAQITDGGNRFVAKSPRSRFSVADEWSVARERGIVEAEILRFVENKLGTLATPRVIANDVDAIVLLESAFGDEKSLCPTYKSELLAGRMHSDVARCVGQGLRALHALSVPDFLDSELTHNLFLSQRIDPYFVTSAQRHPDLEAEFESVISSLVHPKVKRIVHGDANPKNILCLDNAGAALIDWEVVHVGDPSFDLAMMSAHLLLKALREGTHNCVDSLVREWGAFWAGYGEADDEALVIKVMGAIMLARLWGKSRVDYLDPEAIKRAERVGRAALEGDISSVSQTTAALLEGLS